MSAVEISTVSTMIDLLFNNIAIFKLRIAEYLWMLSAILFIAQMIFQLIN